MSVQACDMMDFLHNSDSTACGPHPLIEFTVLWGRLTEYKHTTIHITTVNAQ